VIDVSQSVEHDHPRSLKFLRTDIKNVTDFFRKKGVTILQERTAFEFITAENTSVDPNEMDVQIENLIQQDQAHPATEEVDERVFRQAYIPKSLFEVVDPERDTGIVHHGGKDDLIYAKFLNIQGTKSQTAETLPIAHSYMKDKTEEPSNESIGDHTTNEQSDSSDDSDEDESTPENETATPRGKRHEDKDAKKVCPK
jgi:RIO kinase 1